MNILYLTNHLNTGGITSYLYTLSKSFLAQGHRVYILSSGGNLVEKFESIGVRHFDFGFRLKSDADLRIYWQMPHLKALKDLDITVIHSQTRATQILAERYASRLKAPHVSTCHGFFKRKIARMLFPCWGKQVVAISRAVEQHLIRDFQVDPSQVVLIPNGIDISEFVLPTQEVKDTVRAKYQVKGAPVIGIIARLSDVKGHPDLIRAFKILLPQFPDAQLHLIGEGPEEDNLRRLVESLALTNHVVFSKIVNRTVEILPMLDVFVMPSLQEGLGLSVLEAQAMGLPVVATRVGGLPDIVEDRRTGILVEPRNPKALSEAICEVLRNPVRAWDMGRAARMFVEKKYSSAQMFRLTYGLYQRVTNS